MKSTIDDAVTKTMQGVATQAILIQVAPIILLTSESEVREGDSDFERYSELKSIINYILTFAINNNIELFGDVGVIVDYNSELHSTADGRIPTEASVFVLRSGVRRRRVDGGFDILMFSHAEVKQDLDHVMLPPGVDPTGSGLSIGNVLLLYLAWLTDLAHRALDDLRERGGIPIRCFETRPQVR